MTDVIVLSISYVFFFIRLEICHLSVNERILL